MCISQGLDDLLSLPWVDCTESSAAAAAGELELGGPARLLVEAHEALNLWHDGFIFDGVCDTLAQMAEADARPKAGPR
jgi:hypothetical protein